MEKQNHHIYEDLSGEKAKKKKGNEKKNKVSLENQLIELIFRRKNSWNVSGCLKGFVILNFSRCLVVTRIGLGFCFNYQLIII